MLIDVEVIYEDKGRACRDTWEVEVSDWRGKALIENSHRSTAGMSPHGEAYTTRIDLEKHLTYTLKMLDLQFKKIRGIKKST